MSRTDQPNTLAEAPLSECRILELDGLRGLAIGFILIWHYVGVMLMNAGEGLQPDRWVPSFTLSLILFRSGVDLFFVLSGFLLGGILLDHKNAKHYYGTFYIRRGCRILPLYLVLVLIFASAKHLGAAGPIFEGPIPLAAYFTLTQNYYMAGMATYGAMWLAVTWSLAVEEQFYLFLPFIVRQGRLDLKWALCFCIVTAVVLRIWSFFHYGNTDWPAYVWLPCRLDSLAWGILVAAVLRNPRFKAQLLKCTSWVISVFVVLLAGTAVLDAALARDIGYHSSIWGHTLLSILYAVAILLVVLYSGANATAFLRFKLLRDLGRISYGVYLMHGIVLASFFSLAGRSLAIHGAIDWGMVFMALLCTIAICAASYRWLESPFIRLGKRMGYRSVSIVAE